MRQEVMRWMRNGRVVEMMYIDRNGVISKRRVKLMKLQGDRLVAWDVNKQARRTFCMERVLACLPTIERASGREEGIG
ncbi:MULTISPECIES: hypothetical protein [Exiguobacterium]|uniref:WYL domain-containing protein n=1 Tax=Exiguobacterium chiriqhucha RW-2 TaxID=1345023 RepID=U1N4B5_9BACL|nr:MULTISPECIES: hypothetical protein [Exiguobacterium]ERG67400.1 hypothetical protein M467_08925 [Exiguobacterium chiriqhucha RW-2]KAB2860712.1 MAG: hypothetical protein F9K39_14915 [Exiguobacterium chiriqhucha]